MKERPILFSGPMVRAILEGRKTQTRRVLKPQPAWEAVGKPSIDFDSKVWRVFINEGKYAGWTTTPWWNCPYGQPGDRLWVRESFALVDTGRNCVAYRADEQAFECMYDNSSEWPPIGVASIGGHYCAFEGPWKPSIYMPRWASRITLEVVSVRVERVQDISEEDAASEGCSGKDHITTKGGFGPFACEVSGLARTAKASFRNLWDSINAKRGYSWASNPWVWVIEFRTLEKPSTAVPTIGKSPTNYTKGNE